MSNTSNNTQQSDEIWRLAREYGLDALTSVDETAFDSSLIANLPVEWARSNALLPIRLNGEACVLTHDPAAVSQQEDLALLVGEDLRPILAPQDLIAECIEKAYYNKGDTAEGFLQEMGEVAGSAKDRTTDGDLLQVAEKAPVTQLINLILLEAVKKRASDIHFEPFEANLRVRYRVDGVLYNQTAPPKHLEDALVSRLKVMAHMDISEKRLPQDGMARVRVGDRAIDVRVSTVPVAEGERVVLRLLDRDSALLPLKDLGMSQQVLSRFSSLLREPNGIIIVSGPTGSGKTTTLYAALGQQDSLRKNIMTIEDPIEYQLPNIGQIQVKPKIGLTFAAGLRHILRQDPDIVLVGETRDIETAEIALRASLTGHLVFTTLHTNDAPGSVLRLVDMGVEPYLLASCLRGVLAQRLIRRLCEKCKIAVTPSDEDLKALVDDASRIDRKKIFAPVGCPMCLEGYSGRLGLFELLVVDRTMQELIREGHTDGNALRRCGEANGMTTLRTDGISKANDGNTSVLEVINVTG